MEGEDTEVKVEENMEVELNIVAWSENIRDIENSADHANIEEESTSH